MHAHAALFRRPCIAPALALTLCGAPVLAQQGHPYDAAEALAQESAGSASEQAEPLWAPPVWTIEFQPHVWFAGLGGDLRLPGGSSDASVRRELRADDSQFSPGGALRMRADDWTFTFSGFHFDLAETNTSRRNFSVGGLDIAQGQSFEIDIEYTSFEAMASMCVWRRDFQSSGGEPGVGMRLEVGVGARAYDLDVRMSTGGDRAGGGGTWIEPLAGAVLTIEALENLTTTLAITGGWMGIGDRESLSWSVIVGMNWQVTDTIAAHLGYRFISATLERGSGDDTFKFEHSLAGLTGGVVIRF